LRKWVFRSQDTEYIIQDTVLHYKIKGKRCRLLIEEIRGIGYKVEIKLYKVNYAVCRL
jgi:hypothetical protein